MVSYYDILELPEDASNEDIKRAYRRLALKYHPDKAGPGGEAKFREVNTAYEVLSNPEKKAIYDRYGEAGLSTLDNPLAEHAVSSLGALFVGIIVFFILLISVAMVLVFLFFLSVYVDGGLSSWNYVKAFSPLFVLDVLIGVPVLLVLPVVMCMVCRVDVFAALLCVLCAVVQNILVPICKDRNEDRAAEGRTDFLKWRVWMIPSYIFCVCCFMCVVFGSMPTQKRRWKAEAFGLLHFVTYMPIRFAIRIIQTFCLAVLVALVACRADELITTNWFVCLGMPCYVAGGLLIIDSFLGDLFTSIVYRPASHYAQANPSNDNEGDEQEGNDTHRSGAHSHNNDRSNAASGNRAASNNNNNDNGEYPTEEAANGSANNGGNDHSAASPNEGGAGASARNEDSDADSDPLVGSCQSPGAIVRHLIFLIIFVGLLLATVTMVCVRLNYYYNYGTYDGVLSLKKAFIPLFIIVGCVVVAFILLSVLLLCSMALYDVMEGADGAEMSDQSTPPAAEAPAAAASDDNAEAQGDTPSTHHPTHEDANAVEQTENVSDID